MVRTGGSCKKLAEDYYWSREYPGLVQFDGEEVERIHRVKLIRLGVRPDEIDEMDTFDQLDVMEVGWVELQLEQKQLAKMMANELAKILVKIMPKYR